MARKAAQRKRSTRVAVEPELEEKHHRLRYRALGGDIRGISVIALAAGIAVMEASIPYQNTSQAILLIQENGLSGQASM